MSEATYANLVRLTATRLKARLFRNSVGCAKIQGGRTIRYGLGEGSPDLVGWIPVEITEAMVGRTVAVFFAVETKGRKTVTSKKQKQWIKAINDAGGIAIIAREPADFEELLRKEAGWIKTKF